MSTLHKGLDFDKQSTYVKKFKVVYVEKQKITKRNTALSRSYRSYFFCEYNMILYGND